MAVLVANFTDAWMPSSLFNSFSTRRAHAPQDIPSTLSSIRRTPESARCGAADSVTDILTSLIAFGDAPRTCRLGRTESSERSRTAGTLSHDHPTQSKETDEAVSEDRATLTDQWSAIRHHVRTIQRIESRVLHEVSISRTWLTLSNAVTVVAATSILAWSREAIGQHWPRTCTVSGVTVIAIFVTSTMSALALWRRRYGWCCAAAYCGAVTTVIGMGSFWWVRTGHVGIGIAWLLVADVAVIMMTGGWLTVIITPVERSQPQMRARSVALRAGEAK